MALAAQSSSPNPTTWNAIGHRARRVPSLVRCRSSVRGYPRALHARARRACGRPRVLPASNPESLSTAGDDRNGVQRIRLVSYFAMEGDAEARQAMYDRFPASARVARNWLRLHPPGRDQGRKPRPATCFGTQRRFLGRKRCWMRCRLAAAPTRFRTTASTTRRSVRLGSTEVRADAHTRAPGASRPTRAISTSQLRTDSGE
jgi:hypothetical protein